VNEPGLEGAFWPSDRQKLLLRVAFGDDDAALAAWGRVRPALDLDRLELGTFPLLALVHRRLERLGLEDADLPRLAGIRRRTWYLNRVRGERAAAALRALDDAGAAALVVGGWASVCASHGGDFSVRAVDALDVLVAPALAERAEAALHEAGYERLDDWVPAARSLGGREGDVCVVHTRLAHELSDPAAGREPQGLAVSSRPAELAGTPVRVLQPADELVRICATGARATRVPAVIWAADALALLAAAEASLDWDRVTEDARTLGAAPRLRAALAYLGRELAAPVPDAVLGALAAERAAGRRRLAHRVAGRGVPLLGPAPRTVVRFLHVTADRPLLRALASGPRFLSDELGVGRPARLPLEVARRARTALRLQRAARRRGPARTLEHEGAA
jgi:hypothetical protein